MNEKKIVIGSRIAEERKRLGLNQSYVADKCGVDRKTVGNVERGQNAPSTDYLSNLTDLGFDGQYILTGVHTINADAVAEGREAYSMPMQDRVVRAMSIALDVNQEMGLGLTPEDDQFKTLVGYTLQHHVTKVALKEFIKNAYAVAGKVLPDDNG